MIKPSVVALTLVAAVPHLASAQPVIDPGADVELNERIELEDQPEVATRSREAIVKDTRAVAVVTREDIAQRAARTAPEALAGAAGVSVQKTNHAGGSPYLRGTTGQQVLMMIDGFRFNTSIARSGPNQYLSTIDPQILDRVEVLRGSGSVLYGSDAIGGVVNLITRRSTADDVQLTGIARAASADLSFGGRAEFDLNAGGVGTLAGIGARSFGNLRSGGRLEDAEVPQYNGREQLFTGYDEFSADAKVVIPINEKSSLTTAAIMARQLNAPRTDRCTDIDCRFFDEQFYDLGYVRYTGELGKAEDVSAGLAVMRTREKRRRVRRDRDRTEIELDEVIGLAATGRASIPALRFGKSGAFRFSYGIDGNIDFLDSQARNRELSSGNVAILARGKYIDDSSYATGAGFGFAELIVNDWLSFTGGFRVGVVQANIGADESGGTDSFSQEWFVPVGSVGARLNVVKGLSAVINVDQGFRAPNLDDLTARSQEGPGFQLANPNLDPEESLTVEAGLVARYERFRGTVFGYQTMVDGFIGRDAAMCPAELTEQCGDSENVFVLVNANSARNIGIEANAELLMPNTVMPWSLFANMTWTRGTREFDDSDDTQPLPKIPPFHGRAGARARYKGRYFAELAASFARAQDRLDPTDVADRRIPEGGTPGYVTVDVTAGMKLSKQLRASLVIHNITDTTYRVHGSGVDGAGFGAILQLAGTLTP